MTRRLFSAIHETEYGAGLTLFYSDQDAVKIFREASFNSEEDDDTSPVVQYAAILGLDFEPSKGELLTIEYVEPEGIKTIDFS